MKHNYIYYYSLVLLILIIVGLFVFYNLILSGNKSNNTAPRFIQKRHIILGAWTEGMFDSSTRKLHPEKLLQLEQIIHKKISIAHYYRGWEALTDPILITEFDILRKNGWIPMINVNPYYFSQCPATNLPLYKAIAEGKCDNFLHKAGKNLKQVKQPFYFLFAWEMNNYQNDWSIIHSGSSPDDFIRAWRHIYVIFKQEKAKNIIWVFCPNIPDVSDVSYEKIYPGNDFVDWIGLDGYNWGTTQSWSQWISFSNVFKGSYDQVTSIAPGKPMMIAEVNTTEKGGDKSAWYTDMFTQQIPSNFPKINAAVIFNEDRSKQEGVNWKVDSSPNALNAFISAIHSQLY